MKEKLLEELIAGIRVHMATMTDEQRVGVIDEMLSGYCRCGSASLPCYCQRDE